MLGIFQKTCAHPPEELNSPSQTKHPKMLPEALLREFIARHSNNSFSVSFGAESAAALGYVRPENPFSRGHQRLFCAVDEMYCHFVGSLNNLCSLNRQYGLTGSCSSNEAMLVIEAYRTLRDRGPYPADQVVKDFDGSFAFLVYDSKAATVFVALSSDGKVKLYWGIAADGSVVICDDVQVIKSGCAKSFAPFPPGFMFHSEGGLMNFEHPMHIIRAIPRTDSEGVVCGANFKVDLYHRINSIPRNGSAANWTQWDSHS